MHTCIQSQDLATVDNAMHSFWMLWISFQRNQNIDIWFSELIPFKTTEMRSSVVATATLSNIQTHREKKMVRHALKYHDKI